MPGEAQRNLATRLKRRRCERPMDQYDRLPAAARAWLAGAALPWSAPSVLRLWMRLHRETGGDLVGITARLDQAERRMLARDRRAVWGRAYPGT